MEITTPLREALNKGISSGSLVDTKFILYSRRDSSGRVCRPRALYANSHVLKAVPYFNELLFGNFAESRLKDFKDPIEEDEYIDDYGYLSDSDLEDDEDTISLKHAAKPEGPLPDPFAIPGEKIIYEEYEEYARNGKVVKIPDMAFLTFQAFLMYLYTGMMEFAPFGSEENRRSRSAEIVNPSDDDVPRPSPKSIYRLADKYDILELKALALGCIRDGLGKCDIVEEAFSRFASQYDEIVSLYVGQLVYIWVEDPTEATCSSVEKKIDSFTEGNLEHAAEILSAFWKAVSKDGDIEAPPEASLLSVHVAPPTYWNSMKIALINSIRKGVFFDRKYWARHSNAGQVLKPVYFSSTIMSDKAQQLEKLVRYLTSRSASNKYLGREANIESDCDVNPSEAGDETEAKEEKEEQVRAILIAGSFSAWKSLFFYRCTGEISFAPLKSQGVDSRLNYIRENTRAAAPPPCSPKSIYLLASLLEIQPLCDSAFPDIKNKVSLDNVVEEVFSWVTATQTKIMEMECELFISNLKNPELVSLVDENTRRVSDGSSPHCAGALKLGLRKAIELKKQNRGVLLRCNNPRCECNKNPVPYSVVGSSVSCPKCRDYYSRMLCVGCGWKRSDSSTSCQSCKKRFI